jgi:hypothetical protein
MAKGEKKEKNKQRYSTGVRLFEIPCLQPLPLEIYNMIIID